jgi:hypothetical protein
MSGVFPGSANGNSSQFAWFIQHLRVWTLLHHNE